MHLNTSEHMYIHLYIGVYLYMYICIYIYIYIYMDIAVAQSNQDCQVLVREHEGALLPDLLVQLHVLHPDWGPIQLGPHAPLEKTSLEVPGGVGAHHTLVGLQRPHICGRQGPDIVEHALDAVSGQEAVGIQVLTIISDTLPWRQTLRFMRSFVFAQHRSTWNNVVQKPKNQMPAAGF